MSDPGVLPDRGTVVFALVRIVGIRESRRLEGAGRLAGFIEALLGRVPAMGVEGRWPQAILHPLASLRREPMAALAVDPIVPHQGVGVDTPALPIKRVGLPLGQSTGEGVGTDHWCLIRSWYRQVGHPSSGFSG